MNKLMQMTLNVKGSDDSDMKKLVAYINDLIINHYNQLIQLLYTIDVSETKLKNTLREREGEDAAFIIAQLIIERQAEKKASVTTKTYIIKDIPEEDRW